MVRFASTIALASLSLLLLAGCAKRPALIEASAPAPTGSVQPVAGTPAEPSQPAATVPVTPAPEAAAATPAPRERPAPKAFEPTAELRAIHFDFDRYEIRRGDAEILDANARWLKANPNHLVLIEGHCDDRGTNEYNLALGERRARAAMNYLMGQGVAADRMTLQSYGEERPLCAEQNEACWAKNRRAHFLTKPRD